MSKFLISIEGTMGSGKEDFTRFLRKNFKDNISYSEDQVCTWDNENTMKKFYKDPSRWSFLMEVNSTIKKLKQLWDIINNERNKIIVTNKCPETDKECFVKSLYYMKHMEEKELIVYNDMYDIMKIPKINTIIYLKTDINNCYENIISKHKEGEKGISYEFIASIGKHYDIWIEKLKSEKCVNIVEIDMDKYSDLEGNEETQDIILDILLREIPLLNDYVKWKPNIIQSIDNLDWTTVNKKNKKKIKNVN
jgi:deoxyadenosine/deoxycytidine kinase